VVRVLTPLWRSTSAVAGWVYPTLGFATVIASSLVFLALATASLTISRASVAAKDKPAPCVSSLQS
jgi:hypothetical protein